ncbi:TIGR04211 family SH3 domain-containing protein [Methyloglobulus sp.]|uniref:TIGR04211 family SH3 domain-containing protein n=1 Tax=Methyloglobulus sp. TaxID=2518622 RepID=UPI0032B715F1
MKRLSVFFVLFIVTAPAAYAKTVYVTDNLELPLRSEESNKGKIISLLSTGTPLNVLSENSKSGFSLVKLKSGMQGFIATRNTMPEPPNRSQLDTTTRNSESLQAENTALKEELAKVKTSIAPGTTLEQSLAAERDRLDRELIELKRTASNQIQLKNERDELQENVVSFKRELEQLKLENNTLKDGASQDWFLYGGFLSLAGVILGFILPKLGWRRRNSWDSL